MEQYPLHASFARSRFKKDYEDFYRKSRFRGGNRETFFRHLQNAAFYPLVIELLFSPFSSNLRASQQISFEEFKNKLLKPGLVDRIVVSNESVAKVYARRSPQNQSRYDTIEGSYFEIPIREGVKSCQTRYKYYFDIGSGYSFEKMLGKAQEAMGIDPHDYVPVTYVSEIDWHKAIMWSCVSEKSPGLAIEGRRGLRRWDPDEARRAARRLPIRDFQRKSKARARFVEKLLPSLQTTKLVLGKKLGEGSFRVVYKTSLAKKPSSKDKEVVLKKATEYGAVEIWMNERVRRACANSCADFMYGFRESSAKKGVEYWLIWKFEGESTLADLVHSKEFPYNVIAESFAHIPSSEEENETIVEKLQLLEEISANNDEEISENENLWRQMVEISELSGPAVGLWICGPLMSLIDTAVIGQGSSIELAALGPRTVFCDNTSYVFMFLSIATSNLVAKSVLTRSLSFSVVCLNKWIPIHAVVLCCSLERLKRGATSDICLAVYWIGLWFSDAFLYKVLWSLGFDCFYGCK
ncbi:hypothetical protein CASFOL_024536 [Castilleja foliolosa]|uniref:Uncharacterized protein n=1 Tax=Castilleja foliolosa TaxID=1961234 RepID=A0ABD3CQ04_9LAMI